MGTKILLLADINSSHTQKWAIGLRDQGFEIGIFSFNAPETEWYKKYRITCLHQPLVLNKNHSLYNKISYVILCPKLKKAIREFNPDLLHAHYASSYGLLGALSGFHPYIISAWGTDVMKFPNKNFMTKQIIKFNLRKADAICATSHALEKHIQHISSKKVEVIPFGVDMKKFIHVDRVVKDNAAFTIGCVKALEKIYNIDQAILAFSKLKMKYPFRKLKLVIVGEGTERKTLETLVSNLELNNDVIFEGKLSHDMIANKINEMDVFVNLSEYESFGVSVIEAMACNKPVVVSEAEGLIEIIKNGENGMIVKSHDTDEIVNAIEKYMLNDELRKKVVKNAYERVCKSYNWSNNIQQMIHIYSSLMKESVLSI